MRTEKGSFTNYVDKTRKIGDTENVNYIQINYLHITVKEFFHQCQPGMGRWPLMGKIWST